MKKTGCIKMGRGQDGWVRDREGEEEEDGWVRGKKEGEDEPGCSLYGLLVVWRALWMDCCVLSINLHCSLLF